jgi:DNA polymerase III epsilon subunit-like protein
MPRYAFILDTETTGLPLRIVSSRYCKPERTFLYDSARIVEIAWSVVDIQTHAETERWTGLLRPDGFRIPADAVHGIPHAEAERDGRGWDEVLPRVADAVRKCSFFVGHNVHFDADVLLAECFRHGRADIATLIRKCTWHCTMTMGCLPGQKYPTLSDLYTRLYPDDTAPTVRHRATEDKDRCRACYTALLSQRHSESDCDE